MRLLIVHVAPGQTEATFTLPVENRTEAVVALEGVQHSEELTLVHQPWSIRPKSRAELEFRCSLSTTTLRERYDVRVSSNRGEHLFRVEITREPKRPRNLSDELVEGMPIDSVSAR